MVEFNCPADINVSKKVSEKENTYSTLIRGMQLLYPDYKFEFIAIIAGALGSIPTCLLQGIECLGFTGKECNRIIATIYCNKSQLLEQLRSAKLFWVLHTE